MIYSEDASELLSLLYKFKVKYLIVGGEAVIHYGHARLTGDIDLFFDSSEDNTSKLYNCLNDFWSGDVPGINSAKELKREGIIIQFGVPPNRIDLMNLIDGVEFSKAWVEREPSQYEYHGEKFEIYYISLKHLIENKKFSGRHKDMEDLEYLTNVK